MKELLDKIGSYNLFNYLFPGSLYLGYLQMKIPYDFSKENVILIGFLAYFLGLIISRVGSIIIEPILKKLQFVKFRSYSDFLDASVKDPHIEVLSEQNNMYRSLIALILAIGLSNIIQWSIIHFKLSQSLIFWTLLLFLFSLFLGAYQKQTNYITKRIKKNLDQY